MSRLACTVRGCASPLARTPDGRTWHCARGHRFDAARRGYVNLLQPQDRRSKHPGDTAEATAARGRLLASGVAEPLLARLRAWLSLWPTPGSLLDIGCGEGSILRRAVEGLGIEAHGVDLGVAAIDAAARAAPLLQWAVANADRGLPYLDGAFDAVLSVNARLPVAEMDRVLAPTGILLVAVPGARDLAELRLAVLGEAPQLTAAESALGALDRHFAVRARESVSHVVRLDRDGLHDALSSSYRGARRSLRDRTETLTTLAVTFAWDLLVLQHRQAEATRGAGPDAQAGSRQPRG